MSFGESAFSITRATLDCTSGAGRASTSHFTYETDNRYFSNSACHATDTPHHAREIRQIQAQPGVHPGPA